MKVISGKYKGRNIRGYDLNGTRPTMERVKESLFAILQNNIKGSVVLDLFSGSGNLGIEALSQDAEYAYLADVNSKATKTIKENLSNIGINNAEVLTMDYVSALNYLASRNIKLDLIFLDPPYATNYIEKSIKLISKNHLLSLEGLIICESDSLDRIVYDAEYQIIKEKKYGDKWVVILKQV